ncbi:MAG: glucokinase [Paracoccaceae bacterium]
MTQPLSLVADIGGTNTRVALAEGTQLRPDSLAKFRNAEFAGLEPILARYLADSGIAAVDGACVAAAGPVRDGVAEMTNLSWVIDGGQLTRATGARRVAILNDLQAQGHALGHIAPENLRPLVPGPQAAGGTMLVVGVGTGFNAAPVHDTPGHRIVPPSECGHVNMPVRTAADLRLAHFVERAHGFPGVEDVLSGRGLERLYAFAATEAGRPADLPAADIPAAIAAGDATALATGALFARLLGATVGNLALTHLPFGGVFLIGGVARAMLPAMETMGFAAAFRDKGRFAGFMEDFAVHVVEDDFAALTGCAAALAAN